MLNKLTPKVFLLISTFSLVLGFAVLIRTTNVKYADAAGCKSTDYTGLYDFQAEQAIFEGKPVEQPLFARYDAEVAPVLGVSDPSMRWIEVDLSEQKLKAWDGEKLFFDSPISSGLPHTPTPKGEFKIWAKFRYSKMEGGSGRYYYYLPNVPYVMFFQNEEVPGWRGYSLHGTYWHNEFGTQRSHGCVNLPTPMAEKVYQFVTPVLPDGKRNIYANEENPGTKIVIHD